MDAFNQLQPTAGIAAACVTLGINRASIYRQRSQPRHTMPFKPRPPSALALCETERQQIIEILDSERFVDVAPATIYATLLDEGRYHGSVSTMYRVLKSANQTGERRRQRKHPSYAKPELLAIAPNEVWSWDITKIKGPIKWSYFHLYVILDIFSRYVVGWMIASRETAELAKQLIADTVEKQSIDPGTLTLHADRGTSMRSKPVAALLVDLDVTKTHSRPHTSDDNPFSESQFKTLKYRPDFPERFGSIQDARAHCQRFFEWYNTAHRHSGIGYMTPHAVHHDEATAIQLQRTETLNAAFNAHPQRFRGFAPKPPALPVAAWINPPKTEIAPPLN
jgi:putative transposase